MNTNYWILTCNTSRYDVHTLFKEQGFCFWNQRRDFQVGDVVYLYETKPVSKIIYKTIVEEINIKRDIPENNDNFYTRDYSKDFCVKLRFVASNHGNRLQFKELNEKFDITGFSLLKIYQIKETETVSFFEDVFAGKIENLPASPSKTDLYQPIESGSLLKHIKHKMDYCEIRATTIAKRTGVSNSSIGRARNEQPIKTDNVLVLLDTLDFVFTEYSDESIIYDASEISGVLQAKIISSEIRTNDLASICSTSPSDISHLKNQGILPKLEVFERLLEHFKLKVVARK